MILANWRVICFQNGGYVMDMIKLYKSIIALVQILESLDDYSLNHLSLKDEIEDLLLHSASLQKWVIILLNTLEHDLVKHKMKNKFELNETIFLAYHLFD